MKMSYMFLGNLDLSNFMQILFMQSMVFLIFFLQLGIVFEEHHSKSDLLLFFGSSLSSKYWKPSILSILLSLISRMSLLTY